jgi:hypothetical protein
MTADDRRPPLPPPAHPDLDTLADLHADALDASTAERVRAHASSCPRCGPVLAALDGVRAELRALPVPSMPAAVVARLDATLADLRSADLPTSGHIAAASAGPATGASPAGATPASTAAGAGRGREVAEGDEEAAWRESVRRLDQLELARDRRRRRLARSLGSVAAAVAVIAAAASVTAVVRSGTGGGSDSSAAGGAGTAADSGTLPAPAAGRNSSSTPLSLPPDYNQETLRAALPSIVQRSAVSIITGESETGPAGAMADAGRRTACAGSLGSDRGELRAVQQIRYRGTPAYVFVFENGGTRTGVVVAENCGLSSGLPASVLGTVS